MIHNKRNIDILLELDSYVCGHDDAKKVLINLINRSKVRYYQKWLQQVNEELLMSTQKCLLIGQSGTGKTHLVESLQKIVDFPLIRVDATKLNPIGASGGITQEKLEKMITAKARELVEIDSNRYHSVEGTIDQMVIFIDEIDKLGTTFEGSGNWNRHVQSSFLTMFDNKNELSGVSFIFAGAFDDITKNEKISGRIGFNNVTETTAKKESIDLRIMKSGLIPELVGRINNIVELDKFTEDDYYNILKKVILPKKRIDLAYFNVIDTELSEEHMRELAKNAMESGQGLRALHRELDKEFMHLEFYYEDAKYALDYNNDDTDFDR